MKRELRITYKKNRILFPELNGDTLCSEFHRVTGHRNRIGKQYYRSDLIRQSAAGINPINLLLINKKICKL